MNFLQFLLSFLKRRILIHISITALVLASCLSNVYAGETKLKVVASIKPIHSLIANVMKGVGTLELLLKGASSPHGYSLKPSQSSILQNADLIFWVGPSLEASLQKPIKTIGANAVSIELADLFKKNESGLHTDIHNSNIHHDEQHDEHDHNANAHIWLNPDNAKVMVQKISQALSKADPNNADIFERNANETIQKIDELITSIEQTLAPVDKHGYILFHDAYSPFEQRFGFKSAGIISINPEAKPSAAQLRKLQNVMKQNNVTCVFTEPQFSTRTSALIAEGSNALIGTLDPLGFQITNGTELYFELMENIADDFAKCIGNNS